MAERLEEETERAEEETERAEEAEREAQQARQEAERRITEVESQGNINLRAEPVRVKLAGTIEELAAIVTYAPTKRQKIFRPDRTLDPGAAPSISGWSGASFTGKTGTTSELAYLYTDIGAPAKRGVLEGVREG